MNATAEPGMAPASAARELLASAQWILAERTTGSSPRLAAFLARQAVEILIEARCSELVGPVSGATGKSKLAILTSLDPTSAGRDLILAWYRLSGYCHIHAYELSPTSAEVSDVCRRIGMIL